MNNNDLLYLFEEIKFISQIYIGRTFTKNFVFLGTECYTINTDSVQINVQYRNNMGHKIANDIIYIPEITKALHICKKSKCKIDVYIGLFNLYRKSRKKGKLE